MADDEYSNVRVALRIRPQLAREKIEACRVCTFVTENEPQVMLGKDKAFTYDYVYDMATDQSTFYETCCKNLVEGCFDGYNATVLAYGQTGSGKTYTMGTSFDLNSKPEVGVIPRAFHNLFDEIEKKKENATVNGLCLVEFSVFVEFMELYNEEIIDLLDSNRMAGNKNRTKLKIHEDVHGDICVAGMSLTQVFSTEEALKCLHEGALNRTTASTQMNSTSSRSHAIFSVHLKQTRSLQVSTGDENNDGENLPDTSVSGSIENFESLSAKLHFTDLAGSERLKRTGATGERMREGVSINSGLLALGNVISALGDASKKSRHVPYRDSKLTRVLQDSLGGNSRTLMVACISPSDSDFMETLNTLKYANRARNIKNKVVVNQDSSSKQIQVLRQQIANMQLELTEYRTGKKIVTEEGCEVYNDMYQENAMLQKDNNNLRLKLKVMQESSQALKKHIVTMKTEAACYEVKESVDGEKSVNEIVSGYITEIEDLRSKLIESESMCSILQTKQNTKLGGGTLGRPQTPVMNLLLQAKKDIELLEYKKQNVRRSMEKENASDVDDKEDDEEPNSDNEEENDECANDLVSIASSDEERDAEIETTRDELERLSAQVDLKQQLVDQLEKLQNQLDMMQSQYENKLQLMSEKIKTTEKERDKILSNLDTKKDSDKEKIDTVHKMYCKKIEAMKAQVKNLRQAQKDHQIRLTQQNKNLSQLNNLKSELNRMKRTKEQIDKRLKLDDKKNREHSLKLTKDLLKMKKEYTKKAAEMKRLENKNRQKDHVVLRKAKEIEVLKSNLNSIQSKKKPKLSAGRRNVHGRYHVAKSSRKGAHNPSSNENEHSLSVKNIWSTIQKQLERIEMRNETIASVEKQMQKLIKDREQIQEAKQFLKEKLEDGSMPANQIEQEDEDLQANVEFIDEQIQQCQMEIMQLEKGNEDVNQLRNTISTCSFNVSRYISDNLLSVLIRTFTSEAHAREKAKDLETKLKSSDETAQEAHDLIQCLLQKKSKQNNQDVAAEYYRSNSFKDFDTASTITSSEPSPLEGPAKLLGHPANMRFNAGNAEKNNDYLSLQSKGSGDSKTRIRISRASAKDLMQIKEETLINKPSSTLRRRRSMREKLKLEKIGNTDKGVANDQFTCNSTVVSPSRLRSPEVFSRLMTKPLQNTPHKGKMSLNHSKLSLSSLGLICTHVAEGHKKAVLCVQASDHLLFSGSKDRSVKVWNMVTGQEILSLEGHPNNVNVVRHCPSTGLVYTVSLCYVKVWDIRSKASCIQVLGSSGGHHLPSNFHQHLHRTNEMPDNEQQINDLRLSPDSRHLFCATGTSVNVWDLNTFSIFTKLCGHAGNVMSMAISSDSSSPTVITGSKDHYVKIYEYNDYSQSQGHCSPSATLSPPHMDGVESLVHLADKNILFTSSRDKSIKKWDMKARACVKTSYQAHTNWVCSLETINSNKCGSILISGGRNGVMKAWDTKHLNSLGELKAHSSNINCIASNTESLFTASSDSTVKVWKYNS